MKTLKMVLALLMGAAVWSACSDADGRYIDLGTGETIELSKDEKTGLMVNAETGKPVRIYIDTKTNDTIWGTSGKVINGSIRKTDAGAYV
ncbi:MAG: hypothetical protein K0Q66_676 [Chitinophagaceae bacterium]|nr:hypothetical protein [Chitinophagaceae bacterium]